jgi:hypothetical protein
VALDAIMLQATDAAASLAYLVASANAAAA